MARSTITQREWAIATYLHSTSLKGVSSMRLYRYLNITQKSAWFLAHRTRKAFESEGGLFQFEKEVEADTFSFGGLEKNKHKHKKLSV